MAPRKKPLADAPEPARGRRRRLSPRAERGLGYPTLLAALALAAAGCADPVCGASALDEARIHGRSAISDALALRFRSGAEQAMTGVGIQPHTSIPVPGGMPVAGGVSVVAPPSPPPKAEETP